MYNLRSLSLTITALLVFVLSPLANAKDDSSSLNSNYLEEAQRIRTLFDTNFVKLRLRTRHHYAARMYRLTGESHYGEQAISEVYEIHNRLDYYLEGLGDKNFREKQAAKLIAKLPNTKRGKLRRKVLADTTDERFALYLLYQLAKLNEYGLKHPGHDQFVNYLMQVPLRNLILSKTFIHAYAAQVANYVYWLSELQIADYRLALAQSFALAYPNSKDAKLSKSQFQNKIYGLTHIVLAASSCYQQPVNQKEYLWITDYFAQNLDRILNKTKADVHAEVGLSFLLTGQENHPAVDALRQALVAQIDPKEDMVLSPKGNNDLSLGEHRNVLAYALLNWPKKLRRGPLLLENPKWKAQLPLVYQD